MPRSYHDEILSMEIIWDPSGFDDGRACLLLLIEILPSTA
jgi:hypothetical protein